MQPTLLLKAFEKAEREIQSAKPTHLAQHLSDYIQEQSGEAYGEKSLRNHCSAAKKGNPIDLKKYVADALSVYLGHPTFEAFVKAQPPLPQKRRGLVFTYAWPIAGVLIAFVAIFIYYQIKAQRWMV